MEQGLLPTTSEEERLRSFTEQLLRSTATDEDADSPAPGSVQRSLSAGTAGDPKSSVFASVMNLSNTILGAGALAMPYACAQTGIILFGVLLAAIALSAHVALRLLALCVDKHGLEEARYSSLGEKAFGKLGSTAAMVAVALQQLGPCVIYIQISADIILPILCEVNPRFLDQVDSAACNGDTTLRIQLQLAVVVLFMLPLSMIRSMDSLKFASTLSMCFMTFFAALVVVRGIWVLLVPSLRVDDYNFLCVSDAANGDSSSTLEDENSTWLCHSAAAQHQADPQGFPDLPSGCGWRCDIEPGTTAEWLYSGEGNPLKAIPIICFAFLCHQNMFPVYDKLEAATHKQMSVVSKYSILLCVTVYFVVGIFGYLTFLARARTDKGDVLNLYSVSLQRGSWFPAVMDVSRVGYGVAVVLSYPIMLFELRHIVRLLSCGEHTPPVPRLSLSDAENGQALRRAERKERCVDLAVNLMVIVPCTVVALLVSNVDVVFGLIGSTMSPAIIFIMPSA